MAKAGKKGSAGGQAGSRTGAGRGAAARKTAPKRGGSAVEAVVVEAVEAVPVDGRAEADELARTLREALAEVSALREEARAARAEADGARAACRDALAEAGNGARRLKAEFEALRAQVAEVRGACDAGEKTDKAEGEGVADEPGRKNRLGLTVAPGVVVAQVVNDSPAAVAAVIRGDVIEEANGRAVHSGTDLRDAVEAAPDGSEVTLQLRRAGEQLLRTVHIPKASEENGEGKSRFGVTVAPGVVVAEVFPGGPAAAAGLERGDVIEEVGGQAIHSGKQLLTVVHSLPEGSEVPLAVTRAGVSREVVARLDGV